MFKEKVVSSNEKVIIKIPGVESWTLTDLKRVCKHNKVKGYTKMSREELVEQVKIILDKI